MIMPVVRADPLLTVDAVAFCDGAGPELREDECCIVPSEAAWAVEKGSAAVSVNRWEDVIWLSKALEVNEVPGRVQLGPDPVAEVAGPGATVRSGARCLTVTASKALFELTNRPAGDGSDDLGSRARCLKCLGAPAGL